MKAIILNREKSNQCDLKVLRVLIPRTISEIEVGWMKAQADGREGGVHLLSWCWFPVLALSCWQRYTQRESSELDGVCWAPLAVGSGRDWETLRGRWELLQNCERARTFKTKHGEPPTFCGLVTNGQSLMAMIREEEGVGFFSHRCGWWVVDLWPCEPLHARWSPARISPARGQQCGAT